ncbi:Dual specificity phosphatase Cdc25 [Trichoderma ghanense]|uniref:Dual specificity phosphatase Cdc25 n=1 Tax=Trichoderma ghanense TaxID=65468 RepID=A0ABY2H079_9HYPO
MRLFRLLSQARGFSIPRSTNMSTVTIASLKRVSAKALSEKILAEAEQAEPSLAVIDVRDVAANVDTTKDYIGGHIKGSTNIPSNQLDALMPTLIRKLKDKKTVVFHCALSQQRGPFAALKYLRERDGLLAALGEAPLAEQQEVYLLERGFTGWQEVYGEDERLTEGFRREIWR